MRTAETKPSVDQAEFWELQEVFSHPIFTEGSETDKKDIMRRASLAKYKSEIDYPWDNYFGRDLTPLLEGRVVLDLGCLTGGRGAAWAERYRVQRLIGVDVSEPYIQAAGEFAASRNIPAEYRVARGEAIPLDDGSVDAVLSFDVFEHVQNPETVLQECERVLKPGGMAFLVFPSYYQPMEHHLSLVTRFPGIQYFFSGRTLVRAYWEILEQRGPDANWYKRRSPALEHWERGNTINGLTLAAFQRLIKNGNWKVLMQARLPIAAIGRNSSRKAVRRMLAPMFYPMTLIPGLREIFLHRISFILVKQDKSTTAGTG